MTECSAGTPGGTHTRRCYWDFTQCRWVCRPAASGAEAGPSTDGTRALVEPARR